MNVPNGLRRLPRDTRDFSLGAVYSLPPVSELPAEFVLQPLEIKNQGDTDMCTAFATSAVSEQEEGVTLDPLYFFAKEKQTIGDPTGYGANLRDACNAAVTYGFIEKKDAPYALDKGRDFIADWKNYDPTLDDNAAIHRKKAYFSIDGPYDTFDNIRATIWKFRNEKRAVLSGAFWKSSWTGQYYGIIPKDTEPSNSGHAFAIIGWRLIFGEPCLVIQNSYGKQLGNEGLFYMPREVANRDLIFGNFTFLDMPEGETKESLVEKSKQYRMQKLNLFKKLLSLLQEYLQIVTTKYYD